MGLLNKTKTIFVIFIGILCLTFDDAKAELPYKITDSVVGIPSKASVKQNKTREKKVKSARAPQNAIKGIAEGETPKEELEVPPKFWGGNENTFLQWVFTQLVYPEDAAARRIQGKVVVQFVVDEEGNVCNVKILKGVTRSLNDEVIRIVERSPNWTPGFHHGERVKVRYEMPVIFKLK